VRFSSTFSIEEGRLSVVPPGINIKRFDPARVSAERIAQLAQQWRLPDGVPVIMLPGRLTRSRGHRDLIEAIANLGSRELHCVFVAEDVGSPGYRRELVKLAQRRDLESKLVIADDCRERLTTNSSHRFTRIRRYKTEAFNFLICFASNSGANAPSRVAATGQARPIRPSLEVK